MKLLIPILAITLLSWLAELLLPWWVVSIVAFAVALVAGQRPGRSFVMGFCGVGLCWLLAALFHDIPNNHILSQKMAALFHLPGYVSFIFVTILIGGLTGGMAASTASLIKGKSV